MVSIYLITNEINSKYYVGQTSRGLQVRFKNHKDCARIGRGCRVLSAAIKKYGEASFSIQELCSVEKSQADSSERLWIIALDSNNPNVGYNLSIGGRAPRGYKWRKESREKLSRTNKGNQRNVGRVLSEATKEKISKSLMGHTQLPNSGSFKPGHNAGGTIPCRQKEILRKRMTGRIVSAETRARTSESLKKMYQERLKEKHGF